MYELENDTFLRQAKRTKETMRISYKKEIYVVGYLVVQLWIFKLPDYGYLQKVVERIHDLRYELDGVHSLSLI